MSFLMYDMNTFDKFSSEPLACWRTENGDISDPSHPRPSPQTCVRWISASSWHLFAVSLQIALWSSDPQWWLFWKLSDKISIHPSFYIENKTKWTRESKSCPDESAPGLWKHVCFLLFPCSDLFFHQARLWQELFQLSAFQSLHLMCKEKHHKSPKALISSRRWQLESLRRWKSWHFSLFRGRRMEAISLRILQTWGSFIKRSRLPELWANEIFNCAAGFAPRFQSVNSPRRCWWRLKSPFHHIERWNLD